MEQFVEFFNENLALFFALIVVLFFLLRSWAPSSVTALRPNEAIRLANKDGIFLDVRTDEEYKEGHILDAYHIPLGLLSARVNEIEGLKIQPIIIYCRSGARSSQAGSILKKQGFTQLYHISGGIAAWQQGNLPVTKKESKVKNKKSKNKAKSKDKEDKGDNRENDPPAATEASNPAVTMYVTQHCPFCLRAKHLLTEKGVEYQEIDVGQQTDKRAEMESRSGRDSVPQIFIGDHHVGGYDDLYHLEQQGELDPLLGLHNTGLVSKPSDNGVPVV